MNPLTWEEVSPYIDGQRKFDNLLLGQIVSFVQTLGYKHAYGSSDEFANSGSGFRVTIVFESDWKETVPSNTPMKDAPVRVEVHVSARGPLVTSCGYQWGPTPEGDYRPPREDPGRYLESKFSEALAKAIALSVAEKFNLKYVDREWLRRIRLSEKQLSSDALGSLDFSEPDALNVLFSEFI